MEQVKARFVRVTITGATKLYVKPMYEFEIDNKRVWFRLNRFLAGDNPFMNTEGILTLENGEFVSFDYKGGYLALKKRERMKINIPKE